MSKYKFTPALALKWHPQGSSGCDWPNDVVLHLCSQSESGWQMHLQPSHVWFGQQEGAFYRGQFVLWSRVLMIMRVGVALQVGVYMLWFKFILGLMFFELVSVLFAIVPDNLW